MYDGKVNFLQNLRKKDILYEWRTVTVLLLGTAETGGPAYFIHSFIHSFYVNIKLKNIELCPHFFVLMKDQSVHL